MFKSRVMIEDDAGNKVPLFNEGILARFSAEKAGRVAAAAYDTSRTRTLGAGEIVVLSVGGVLIGGALILNDMGVWPNRPPVEVLVGGIVVCSPLFVVGAHYMRKTQSKRLRGAMLGAKLCPSCGYDLPTITAGPNARPGLVQCPECGAFWKRPSDR